MSGALHYVGEVSYTSQSIRDGYKATARAVCLKLDGDCLHQIRQFDTEYEGEDERQTLAFAIRGAAEAAMAWCERENTGRRLS